MTNSRLNISSGSTWEDIVGYSRAVKVGNHIYVSGTTATINRDDNKIANDPYLQTKQCINKIQTALLKAGSSLNDVIRIRIYVVNIEDWEKIGYAIKEKFADIKPTATMVEISRLIAPGLLVEIEAEAYLL